MRGPVVSGGGVGELSFVTVLGVLRVNMLYCPLKYTYICAWYMQSAPPFTNRNWRWRGPA